MSDVDWEWDKRRVIYSMWWLYMLLSYLKTIYLATSYLRGSTEYT